MSSCSFEFNKEKFKVYIITEVQICKILPNRNQRALFAPPVGCFVAMQVKLHPEDLHNCIKAVLHI